MKRFFGSGPACFIIGVILILLVYYLESLLEIPKIPFSNLVSGLIFIIAIILTLILMVWGFLSLPFKKRGREIVTDNAFRYFRHPIYAAFIDFFVFGLAFYLKSYLLIITGVALIFICGKIVDKEEEEYLIKQFGKKYREYQKTTKKFIPKVY
jgi:protein-S-isoprenylcysteine O-methyltransferase Ste14